MASIYWPVNLDYTNILQNNGYIELDVWLPDANLTEINLVFITDTLDFYTLSATAFSDGTAFSTGLNQWKTLAFSFVGDAVVGSPKISQITAQRVDFVLNGSFGASVVPDFRIDNMRTVIPDYMDLIYLSSYKGTDATGATKKIFLDEYTDIPYFGTDGTSVQVFVWNSTTPAHITVNGGDGDTLQLGNVKAFVGWAPMTITVSAIGSDGTVKSWTGTFPNSNYFGTYAQIFVLGMHDLR